ncbi:hypothetical protein SAMN06265171_109134 [Chryseobacterium rhizoplanae]|uniref:Uncharacterized protein n=1 Tax=Chryseobacterium rhizoplanae TaxID=1609531 RepID=A0A521ESK3_9FLAO|nr:hypothetical protein SAMN06265171_109134 [Chryseobacterium rhizoplanae]
MGVFENEVTATCFNSVVSQLSRYPTQKGDIQLNKYNQSTDNQKDKIKHAVLFLLLYLRT